MRCLKRWFLAINISLLILPGGVAIPQIGAPEARETVEVTLVEVPVTVVDRAGNPVRGLTAANFEIFEGRKQHPITNFEMVDVTKVSSEPANAALSPAARRNFLLLFDLTYSSPIAVLRAREAAASFVRSGIAENDLSAVGTISAERGFRLLTSFSTDRQLALEAIETLGAPMFFKPVDPLLFVTLDPSRDTGSTSRGREELQEHLAEISREFVRGNDQVERSRVQKTIETFGGLAKILDNVRGRKQVILLSEGFEARFIHGRESLSSADAQADTAASVSGEVWKVDNDQRFGTVSSKNELDQMAQLFKRSDVVLHAVDIKGLRSNVDASAGAKIASNEGLFLLADPTGGEVFKNANELGTNFSRILRQQEVVYVLGFQAPAAKKPGEFHELDVRLKNVPGRPRVSHRAGYYEAGPEESQLERVLAVGDILANDIPFDQLPFDLFAAPFPDQGGLSQVPVILEIDGPKLLAGIGGDTASGELFIYAFDDKGSAKDFIYQRVQLDLTKLRATLSESGIRYFGTLHLPPGAYQVKALYRVEENGAIGFRRTDVRVPDFRTPVVLRPFLLSEAGKWLMLKAGSSRGEDPAYPFTVAGESFVPGVAPELQKDGRKYRVALFTYHVKPEGMSLTTAARSSTGAVLPVTLQLVGRTPVDADGNMQLLFDFEPGDLATGRYFLDFNVKGEGQPAQVVSMPFIVR